MPVERKGEGQGWVATYRCAHHHPVIPMARAENLESHIKPQRKTGSGNRERYELDDDEGRAPGLGVDVIRGRPRGHDLRRREPHTFGWGGVPCVAVAVGSNHKHPRRRMSTVDMCVRGVVCGLAGNCLLQELNGLCWSRGSVADMIRTVGTSSRKRNPG